MIKYYLTFSFCIINIALIACSCSREKIISLEEFDDYAHIMDGVVLSADTTSGIMFRIKVLEEYKGVLVNDTISIYTHLYPASCGLHAQINDKWTFYLYQYSGYDDLVLSRCSRSRIIQSDSKGWKRAHNKEFPRSRKFDLRQVRKINRAVANKS